MISPFEKFIGPLVNSKSRMPRRAHVVWVWLMVPVLSLLLLAPLQAETSSQSQRARDIAALIWQSNFTPAVVACQNLVREEPLNPLGYCLLGMTYYYMESQYRTDRYALLVMANLDTAIALAGKKVGSEDLTSERLLVLGSAFGYRALERSVKGGWWGAQRDGHHSCVSLEKAYDLDTTLSDALFGIGNYHYWKSAKTRALAWLPFISDNRRLGISEIKRVTKFGLAGVVGARISLLPIYLNERRYAEVIATVDSLSSEGLVDPGSLLFKTRAEIALSQWDGAALTLETLRQAWDSSPLVDSCGACEADYLRARILAGRGETAAAEACVREILANNKGCLSNAYFRETVSEAQDLPH